MSEVAGNQIPRTSHSTTDRRAAGFIQNTVQTIPQCCRTARIRADVVAADDVADARIRQMDAVLRISADDVAFCSSRSPNDVACCSVPQIDPGSSAQCNSPRLVRADLVSDERIGRDTSPGHVDSKIISSDNNIATQRVARSADVHTAAIANPCLACLVHTNVVAFHHGALRRLTVEPDAIGKDVPQIRCRTSDQGTSTTDVSGSAKLDGARDVEPHDVALHNRSGWRQDSMHGRTHHQIAGTRQLA